MRLSFFFFILLVMILSCKDDLIKSGDPQPKIQFVSINPNSVIQFQDSVVITISYEDGDGDLGDYSADSLSISIRDTRLVKPDFYHLKPLAPKESNVKIKGQLDIKLKNLFLLGQGKAEQTQFEIKLKDRNQNWSNTVTTSTIAINR